MAKAFNAGFHRIVHRAWPVPVGSRDRVTRYRHFSAACSVGKWPLALIARRYRALRDSIVIWSPVAGRGCDLGCFVEDSVLDEAG